MKKHLILLALILTTSAYAEIKPQIMANAVIDLKYSTGTYTSAFNNRNVVKGQYIGTAVIIN